MEHNILTQILYLVGSMILGGGAAVAYGRRGSANSGFLMNQGRSRISNAVGRSNTHANNTSEAEGLLIETAKMSIQDREKTHQDAMKILKELGDVKFELGKAQAKAEILEKERFPETKTETPANDMFLHNPLFEPQPTTEQEGADAVSPLPETPLKKAANTNLEIVAAEQRQKHLLIADTETKRVELEFGKFGDEGPEVFTRKKKTQ